MSVVVLFSQAMASWISPSLRAGCRSSAVAVAMTKSAPPSICTTSTATDSFRSTRSETRGGAHNCCEETLFHLCEHDRARAQMTNYLSSVFKVLYQTSPDTRESIDVGPEELAAITAQQCFEDADLNHDGRLSYDEFQRWYSLPSGGGVAAAAASVAAAHQLPATYSAEEICADHAAEALYAERYRAGLQRRCVM